MACAAVETTELPPGCANDCTLPGCESFHSCSEDCADGIDNDLDGQTDCQDSDCVWQPICAEDCSDGLDNDYDGFIDCADSDCEGQPICAEDCIDGLDNDVDGLVDCEDADCASACSESDCTDGEDNNANGLVDCEDSECWGLPGCEPEIAVRILSGSAHVRHTPVSYTSSSAWVSGENQRLTMREVVGTASYAFPNSNIHCDWAADGLILRAGRQHAELFSGATYNFHSNLLRMEEFESTGACEPWLSHNVLNFGIQKRSSDPLDHSVVIGKWGYLDGALWAAGSISFSYMGSSRASYSFQVDSALTEPWVFSP